LISGTEAEGDRSKRGGVILFVLHRVPAIGSPRDFIRFSRCQFSDFAVHVYFGALETPLTQTLPLSANHSNQSVTTATSLFKNVVAV